MTEATGPLFIDQESSKQSLFSYTRGMCNICGKLTDAKIGFEGERVIMSKWCPEHGITRALISSSKQWFLNSQSYVKPGTDPIAIAVSDFRGCPDSCGLCSRHQQHTCVPILEITQACNMACPICLVDNACVPHLTVEDVGRIVDGLVRTEGSLNMLTVSGGEPTQHPDLLKILDEIRRPEMGVVSLSTNGLALLDNPKLIRDLKERKVVISLQFDGTSPQTYQTLRGDASLAAKKIKIIEQVLAEGAQLSLTLTIAKGVNEHEVPEILRILFEHDGILSLMVQPLSYAGKAMPRDMLDVITIPDAVALLADGSGGLLSRSDFSPLPCSHPSCFALTYLLKTEGARFVSLPSIIDPDIYLDIIKNEALFGTDMDNLIEIKDALYKLWTAGGQIPDRELVLRSIKRVLLELNRLGNKASHRDLLDIGTKNVKSIFIHHFMDRSNFDLSRVIKCCNHYPQADGRLMPACVRNNYDTGSR